MVLELHVWGCNDEISVISPQSIASAWIADIILTSQGIPFEIIASNNTNLSPFGELPVLIDDSAGDGDDNNRRVKLTGFRSLSSYLVAKYGASQVEELTLRQKLLNDSVVNSLNETFDTLNQYNLYSNAANYEKYTRKLFTRYFPFPMMYNQPSKFYKNAQEKVKILGLDKGKSSFFSFSTEASEVAETETFNEGTSDADAPDDGHSKGISGLHEKYLLQKSKTNEALRESSNSMRCLMVLDKYLARLKRLRESNGGKRYLFGDLPSTSDILFTAYMSTLTCKQLPDAFIAEYLSSREPELIKETNLAIRDLHSHLQKTHNSFAEPKSFEVPSLYNEILYWTGLVKF
ncbi:uncharacterized protein LODBEIA_P44350 [Lodderomyces beijingensis]|uniref:Mitochondrial outer membrane transport complex Sam37/metaxin N-terminal domain-containing protein n=1 Tax=Lodderomyces beijingensis TaxID=1775926 RepID=A0ABP0ZPW8_9ASCO